MARVSNFAGAAIAAGVLLILALSITIVPAGHVGVKDFFGNVSDRILQPGLNLVFPFTRVIKLSVRTREIKETAAVPTSEGLIVNLDVSLLFHLKPDEAVRVYKTIGKNFDSVVIDPQLRSVIRDVTAEYEAKFLYSSERELVAKNMFKHIKQLLGPARDRSRAGPVAFGPTSATPHRFHTGKTAGRAASSEDEICS
jgi:regulator of protease activity HflC (stomatin/prohibitin superfamily)